MRNETKNADWLTFLSYILVFFVVSQFIVRNENYSITIPYNVCQEWRVIKLKKKRNYHEWAIDQICNYDKLNFYCFYCWKQLYTRYGRHKW